MFITQSQHRRDSVGRCIRHNVDDGGLGLVVTETTRFDPQRMKQRFIYWLEVAANEMAVQARQQIAEAGMEADEGGPAKYYTKGQRDIYRDKAIASIPFNEMSTKARTIVASWSSEVVLPKMKKEGIGQQIAMMYVSLVTPYGLIKMISGFLGKKKKPKMQIPWNTIYAQAMIFAQDTVVQEEVQRMIEEKARIKTEYRVEVEKVSQRAAQFKLPEGATGIKRGALVLALKGGSVEVRK
jgi:hypothetical protein